jgi:hypothetical protein
MMIDSDDSNKREEKRAGEEGIRAICRRTIIKTAARREQTWNSAPNQVDSKGGIKERILYTIFLLIWT